KAGAGRDTRVASIVATDIPATTEAEAWRRGEVIWELLAVGGPSARRLACRRIHRNVLLLPPFSGRADQQPVSATLENASMRGDRDGDRGLGCRAAVFAGPEMLNPPGTVKFRVFGRQQHVAA